MRIRTIFFGLKFVILQARIGNTFWFCKLCSHGVLCDTACLPGHVRGTTNHPLCVVCAIIRLQALRLRLQHTDAPQACRLCICARDSKSKDSLLTHTCTNFKKPRKRCKTTSHPRTADSLRRCFLDGRSVAWSRPAQLPGHAMQVGIERTQAWTCCCFILFLFLGVAAKGMSKIC